MSKYITSKIPGVEKLEVTKHRKIIGYFNDGLFEPKRDYRYTEEDIHEINKQFLIKKWRKKSSGRRGWKI